MSATTKISWTDATWSPIRGCMDHGPGCVNCYAKRMMARGLPGLKSPTTGKDFAIMTPHGPRWTGEVELIESQLDVPLHWRKPRRIFVDSISDTMHKDVSLDWLERIWRVMLSTPHHTYIVLTKRGERLPIVVPQIMHRICGPHWAPPAHIHFGVSISIQADADREIPHLLATPAAVRFVSLEPMLERVTFRWAKWKGFNPPGIPTNHLDGLRMLDGIIVGGESGPGARPCSLEDIRSVVRECAEARVNCYVKQLGAVWAREGYDMCHTNGEKWDHKGGNPAEWPEDLRVRQLPGASR